MNGETAARLVSPIAGVFLSALAGCAGERPVSADPVVIPVPEALSPRDAAFVATIEEISRLLRDGAGPEAARRLEAVRSNEVPEAYAPAVEALGDWLLAVEVEEALSATSRVEVPRTEIAAGERIHAKVTLVNPGPHTIRLSPKARGSDAPRGILTVTFQEWGPLGARGEASVPVRFDPPEAVIGPGESVWREVPIDTPKDAPFALLEVRLAATLIPARVEAGKRPIPVRRLEVSPAVVRVFPPGWEGIAAGPLDALRKALRATSPTYDRHVLTAAALVSPADREEALRACIEALDLSNPRRQASAMAALQYLTGRTDLPFEPTVWRRWWRERVEGGNG